MPLLAVVVFVLAAADSPPASGPATKPKTNLEYWLEHDEPATAPASGPATAPAEGNPFAGDRFARPDALPGVVILSDGTLVAGGLFTTAEKDWEVWVEAEKRWRHIPPVVVLSISTVVEEEAMEPEWRWKEMGSDEKVFTGRSRPFRRFLWRLRLIDDSTITGAVKGQPLWVESPDKTRKLFILHERSAGEYGQTLKDLVYPQRVVVSRRAMEEALK